MARPAKTVCEKHNTPRVFFPRTRDGVLGRESYCRQCDKERRPKYKHKRAEYKARWRNTSNGKQTEKNSFLLRT